MNKNKNMSYKSRYYSFVYAISGLKLLLAEPNVKIHFLATVVVIIAGYLKHLSSNQWIAISLAISIVWITEALNTCTEKLCDFACDNQIHPSIKIIKDIAAGAVLIAALTSCAIAVIIFFIQ